MQNILWHRKSGFSDVAFEPEKVSVFGFITKASSTYAVIARESGGPLFEARIGDLEYVPAAPTVGGEQ